MNEGTSFVAFAGKLADAARAVTLAGFSAAMAFEDKGEDDIFDPVTATDREAERVMRSLIEARFPDHGIEGEELGLKASGCRYKWSLDPIDGTRAFICGLPSWTTLIALMEDGNPVLGIIDAPMVGERYVGTTESTRLVGAKGTRAIGSSKCCRLAEARLSTTDPYLFAGIEAAAFERLRRSVKVTRFGFDAYAYARLAAGGIDVVAERGLRAHDYQALVPVVRGAGGVIGNWGGGSDISGGDVLAAATQELFDEAVSVLSA